MPVRVNIYYICGVDWRYKRATCFWWKQMYNTGRFQVWCQMLNVMSDRSERSQLENRPSVWIKATGTHGSQTRGQNCATLPRSWLYRESEGILAVPVCLSEVECNRVDVIWSHYLSMMTGSEGVSFLLPQLFFSQQRLGEQLKRQKRQKKVSQFGEKTN